MFFYSAFTLQRTGICYAKDGSSTKEAGNYLYIHEEEFEVSVVNKIEKRGRNQ